MIKAIYNLAPQKFAALVEKDRLNAMRPKESNLSFAFEIDGRKFYKLIELSEVSGARWESALELLKGISRQMNGEEFGRYNDRIRELCNEGIKGAQADNYNKIWALTLEADTRERVLFHSDLCWQLAALMLVEEGEDYDSVNQEVEHNKKEFLKKKHPSTKGFDFLKSQLSPYLGWQNISASDLQASEKRREAFAMLLNNPHFVKSMEG